MINIIINKIKEEEFLSFVAQVNIAEPEEEITVYLNSGGGDPTLVPAFRHLIEERQIRLVGHGKLMSAALDLFLLTNTKREVLDYTLGLFHQAVITKVSINHESKVLAQSDLKKIWKHTNFGEGLVEQFLELSPSDLAKVKKGDDLYFDHEKLRKALNKSENYFKSKK